MNSLCFVLSIFIKKILPTYLNFSCIVRRLQTEILSKVALLIFYDHPLSDFSSGSCLKKTRDTILNVCWHVTMNHENWSKVLMKAHVQWTLSLSLSLSLLRLKSRRYIRSFCDYVSIESLSEASYKFSSKQTYERFAKPD